MAQPQRPFMTPDAKKAKPQEEDSDEEEEIAPLSVMAGGSAMKVKAKRARLDKLVVELSVHTKMPLVRKPINPY